MARILRTAFFKTPFSSFLPGENSVGPMKPYIIASRCRRRAPATGAISSKWGQPLFAGQLYFLWHLRPVRRRIGRPRRSPAVVREPAEETGLAAADAHASAGWTAIFDRQHVAASRGWISTRRRTPCRGESLYRGKRARTRGPYGFERRRLPTRLPAFMVAYLSRASAAWMKSLGAG
jgi:hypothetical protein